MSGPEAVWDPEQYLRFAEHRRRPLDDLLARVRVAPPGRVLDVGCGPGPTTKLLADRWPRAEVVGIDSSAEMVDRATAYEIPGRLSFVRADLRDYQLPAPYDVIVANAVLQWLPDQRQVIADLASWLRPGGALAVQVPDNFGEPSHLVIEQVRSSPRWRQQLGDGSLARAERVEDYWAALTSAGLRADVWRTTYLHLLTGPSPVLEWIKGTALRPLLTRLSGDDTATFLADVDERLRDAYPSTSQGTVFRFTRILAVGRLTMDS